jgi:hypothetical protein
MKNFILGLVVAGIIVTTGFIAYQLGTKEVKKSKLESTTSTVSPTIEISSSSQGFSSEIVGNDKDEHGCIGSAGYQWCEMKKKCLRSWEEACVLSDANDTEMIKQALIRKNNWTNMEIEITISRNDGKYASGGVREKNTQTGGIFFAVKNEGVWQIVADGNGIITCAELAPYPDYPTIMIPECYDEKINQIIKRQAP